LARTPRTAAAACWRLGWLGPREATAGPQREKWAAEGERGEGEEVGRFEELGPLPFLLFFSFSFLFLFNPIQTSKRI